MAREWIRHSKRSNIKEKNRDESLREGEPSFKEELKDETKYHWEQGAVKHTGVTRKYIEDKYGSKAFKKNGDLKLSYVEKALKEAKRKKDNKWSKRLSLAITFIKQK